MRQRSAAVLLEETNGCSPLVPHRRWKSTSCCWWWPPGDGSSRRWIAGGYTSRLDMNGRAQVDDRRLLTINLLSYITLQCYNHAQICRPKMYRPYVSTEYNTEYYSVQYWKIPNYTANSHVSLLSTSSNQILTQSLWSRVTKLQCSHRISWSSTRLALGGAMNCNDGNDLTGIKDNPNLEQSPHPMCREQATRTTHTSWESQLVIGWGAHLGWYQQQSLQPYVETSQAKSLELKWQVNSDTNNLDTQTHDSKQNGKRSWKHNQRTAGKHTQQLKMISAPTTGRM